ncbi:hypothetical protein DI272_28105 [Streptomyces sp. Act143]|uniref:hypothetical protein n=1 Tax=Streptomyces sp. Act143 TaxID=2200760 RepID=UPI000D680813|nr:hypothetical protein [Streptomyces sp. Act143]PWI17598.1 hypothetical protein DI272_28105 [Streptomyces sp. Act143]
MSVSEGRKAYDGEGGRGSGGAGGRGPRGRGGERGPGRRRREQDGGRAVDAARLPEELRALGRSLDAAEGAEGSLGSETMVERVLGQILAEQLPVPVAEPRGARERLRAVRRWTRLRWRSLTATLCGLLTVLTLTPPVRAAVYDWFDFGGVEVRYDPSAVPSPGAEVPGCGRSVSWAQAVRRAGFEPLVPDALGTPDAVSVTEGPSGRALVGLCWRERGGTVRLDEFAAGLDLAFTKTVREQPEWISLSGAEAGGANDIALWFPRPHLLRFWLVDADGERYRHEERTAGPTLLWTREAGVAEVTLRLEGVESKARALEIARSLPELVAESGTDSIADSITDSLTGSSGAPSE